jgi:potassium-transporting ATPase KdpC subunit
MLVHIRPVIVLLCLMTLLTGLAYPLAVTSVGQSVFPEQATGSMITREGRVIGSALIGQNFVSPPYFHPRPSAVNYNAAASGASNLAPTSNVLIEDVAAHAAAYRRSNSVTVAPIDAVTASGSGLDPHISPENAYLQVARVAQARAVPPAMVRGLVNAHTERPLLGLFGEPHVNVLLLNLALDRAYPVSKRQEKTVRN